MSPAKKSLPCLTNYIDNEFVQCEKYMESFNPALGLQHLLVPDSDEGEVEKAVESASVAFTTWSKSSPATRSDILFRIASLLEQRLDEFAFAESRDQGKPVWLAKSVDIPRAIHNFRFFASYILHLDSKCTLLENATNYVVNDPIGVVALISPWNLPLYLLTWKIAPCIAYGCTAVCKPSEFTSHTAFLLCSVLKDAGLPAGVVNMVFGTGPGAGEPLIKHNKVRAISFTGGTVTGSRIASASAPLFKKISLELGGKNANIVFADCEFDLAVETSVLSSFSNQGGSRIFVQRDVYEKFLEAFIAKTKLLVVGDPADSSTNLGALISKQHLEKVQYYVNLAVEERGKIECGGTQLTIKCLSEIAGELKESQKGYFFAPTVITGVCQEEIFGPVVTVIPFDTEGEAIDWANDTAYGLSCSIWTRDGKRGRRVARSINVGTAWVNCWMARDLNCPFGGQKASGLGREGGQYSREFFTEEKTICMAD